MSTLPSSPVASDLAANAAGVQAAWETPEVLAEFEDKNLVPLIPMLAAGGYSTMCSKPMTSLDDWKGKQLRVGSAAAGKQVTDLGATPVSLSFPETYEALQRGTVDCDLGQLAPNVEAGTFEVAPNIGVASECGNSAFCRCDHCREEVFGTASCLPADRLRLDVDDVFAP